MARKGRARAISNREDDANRRSNAITRKFRVPRIISNGGVTRVVGNEMLPISLNTKASFQAYQVVVNFFPAPPGSITMFGTWLARQAELYNKFKLNRMCLRYVPACPSSTPGRIMLAWNTDYEDTNPTNPQQISQYQSSVETPVWREVCCNAQIPKTPEYTVTKLDDNEKLLCYPGTFLFSSDLGPTNEVSAGSLYIEYDVSFWSRAAFQSNF